MKIASFNVENLFIRAKIFNQDDNNLSTKVLKATSDINALFEKSVYSTEDKDKMKNLLLSLGLDKSDTGDYVILRQIREHIIKRSNGEIQIIAEGRSSWIGWIELKTEAVNDIAMMNTGRVIRDLNADIIAVVEAENRITLKKFSEQIIKLVQPEVATKEAPYSEIMLIDGNDDRGIDVGIMTKNGYNIGYIYSHISDKDKKGNIIFSRDCPEYQIFTPSGKEIWVLPNHFKSKFGGDTKQSKEKRLLQATRTAEIYNALLKLGNKNIIVLGDLNDTPDSSALKPLLGTSLKDVTKHPKFDPGEFKGIGTFDNGSDNNKIDYLLLSPSLFKKIKLAGIFRKGAYPGKKPKWKVYPELKLEVHAASDHHAIWAELDIN